MILTGYNSYTEFQGTILLNLKKFLNISNICLQFLRIWVIIELQGFRNAPPKNLREKTVTNNSLQKEGRKMNYLAWSMEYKNTADELAKVIDKLKAQRASASPSAKKELDRKISKFRIYFRECMETASLLRERHSDAA